MIKLSAIIIARNAQDIIGNCLDSVSFCDEVLVIDGGSTDKTKTIAKQKGASIIDGSGSDFSKQRNIGLAKAKGEWVLYIDTDERVTPSLREEIIKYTNAPISQYNALKVYRQNYYFGNHPWPKIEKLERLFKKSALKGWYGQLHESPEVTGEIGQLNGILLHYSHQDLSAMVEKTNEWSTVEATLRFKQQHPVIVSWRFFRVMLTAFFDSYLKQGGWKAGTAGLVESIYQSFSIFITYAKLWEMQIKSSQ